MESAGGGPARCRTANFPRFTAAARQHSGHPPRWCRLLKVLLAAKSEQHHVAPRLVASSDDIDRLALEEDSPDVPALHGWRREVFGNDALLLKQGRIALGVEGRKLKFIPL